MVKNFKLIACDVETGGFHEKTDALLSVALVKLDENFDPIEKLWMFLLPEPGFRILSSAAVINGYTPEKWAERGAVPLSVGLKSIYYWIHTQPRWSIITPLAHNAPFDQRFLDFACEHTKIDLHFNYAWKCSRQALSLWRDITNTKGNCKLDSLRIISDYPACPKHHDALDDTLACAAGYKWLINDLKDRKQKTIPPLVNPEYGKGWE